MSTPLPAAIQLPGGREGSAIRGISLSEAQPRSLEREHVALHAACDTVVVFLRAA